MPPAEAFAAPGGGDPLGSARWGRHAQKQVLQGATVIFDPRVKVNAPSVAENPMQVPVTIDATALPGVQRCWSLPTSIPSQALRFPETAHPFPGLPLKLQQSSPVRRSGALPTASGMSAAPGEYHRRRL